MTDVPMWSAKKSIAAWVPLNRLDLESHHHVLGGSKRRAVHSVNATAKLGN